MSDTPTLTTYQQINQRAALRKQQAAKIKPLTKSQLVDHEPETIIVLGPSLDDLPANRRSTTNGAGQWLQQFVIIQRPTEAAAMRRSQNSKTDHLVVIRQDKRPKMRYCFKCCANRRLSLFDRDDTLLHGWAYYCKKHRLEVTRMRWIKRHRGLDTFTILINRTQTQKSAPDKELSR